MLAKEDSFALLGGCLWKYPDGKHVEDMGDRVRLQLCIPSALADQIIEECHDSMIEAAHGAVMDTILQVKKRFYIHGVEDRVKKVIDECGLCPGAQLP